MTINIADGAKLNSRQKSVVLKELQAFHWRHALPTLHDIAASIVNK